MYVSKALAVLLWAKGNYISSKSVSPGSPRKANIYDCNTPLGSATAERVSDICDRHEKMYVSVSLLYAPRANKKYFNTVRSIILPPPKGSRTILWQMPSFLLGHDAQILVMRLVMCAVVFVLSLFGNTVHNDNLGHLFHLFII